MMHPVLHMTISMDVEAVQYICATIAFIAACFVLYKNASIRKEDKNG